MGEEATFNPFTGNLDIVESGIALADVDRLTSTNSTLILSDDATDQTLTGSLGILNFTGSTTYDFSADINVTGDVGGTTIGGITEANLLDKSASETVSGEYTFSTFPITPSTAPDADYEVANKKYVDDAGGGDVSKVGTPVNNQVGVWTGDGTIEGDADLTFDGTDLVLAGGSVTATVPAFPAAVFNFWKAGSGEWGINLGNEEIANVYIGLSQDIGSSMTNYFWRANWNTAGAATNTFYNASQVNTMATVNILRDSGQTGDLFQLTSDGGTQGDLFKISNTGEATFTVFPITPSAAPDADYEVANKKYVDDNSGGGLSASADETITGHWDFQNTTDAQGGFEIFDSDGGNPIFSVNTITEKIGIGHNNPIGFADSKIHMKGSGSGTGGRTTMTIENTTANSAADLILKNSAGNIGAIQLSGPSYSIGETLVFSATAEITFETDGEVSTGGQDDIIFKPGGYALSNKFVIFHHDKKMGVSTLTPVNKLDVAGNVVIGSNHAGSETAPTDGLQVEGETELDGTLTLADAVNIVVDTTTGTKIGTATNQKLGFYNATPVVQQTGCAVPTDLATCISEITVLRTALNNLGLTTVV